MRAVWRERQEPEGADFQTCVRGGAWTKQHKRITADAVAAMAATPEAKQWLHSLEGNRMASFSILKFGEEAAMLMASEWCRRRQHFFNLWTERATPENLSFSQAELSRPPVTLLLAYE